MPRSTTAAVILAAGGSVRMGGAQKLLEVLGDLSMVHLAARAALDAEAGPVVVVTGDRHAEVEAALPEGATVVFNPQWSEGMSTSLAAGVRALPDSVKAFAVGLGDMPLITRHHYRQAFAAWSPGHIVVPTFEGAPGHPVVLDASFIPEILNVTGDRGARVVVRAWPEAVHELPLDDPAIVTDVDDPSALARVRALVSSTPRAAPQPERPE